MPVLWGGEAVRAWLRRLFGRPRLDGPSFDDFAMMATRHVVMTEAIEAVRAARATAQRDPMKAMG
jgi:hypothetical protein